MKIRELRSTDYKIIHSLIINEMQHDEVSFANMSSWLDLMRGDKSQLLFVAEIDEHVVGFVSAIKSVGCIDGFFINICCLAVSQSYQGKAIGKALLNFIEKLGQSEGIMNFTVSSGLHRTKTHCFYEKNNYEKGGYCFYKGLVIVGKEQSKTPSSSDKTTHQ